MNIGNYLCFGSFLKFLLATCSHFLSEAFRVILCCNILGSMLISTFNCLFLTGAIEVSIANMYKEDRSATDEVYVVSFVPSYLLPKRQPNALDPFLESLISEIKDIVIDGIEICFSLI